jgi:membrane associated rhomboid family serine protease
MDFEFNPIALIFGAVGGLVTVAVMKQVEVNIIFKIMGFLMGAVAGYFISAWRLNAD